MDTFIPKMPAGAEKPEWGDPKPRPSGSIQTPWWAIGFTILLIGALAGAVWFFTKAKPAPTPNQVEAPILSPTPTPVRSASPVATTSAFLALEQSVASLATALGATSGDDPTLTPPIIELDLGLGSQ